jgi:hypothetical protein
MKTNKALDVHETERKNSHDTLACYDMMFLGHKLDQLPGTARDAAKKSFLILMQDPERARGASKHANIIKTHATQQK